MGGERLVERAAMEVLSLRGREKWLRNLELCLADVGWGEMRLEKEMSSAEVKCMLYKRLSMERGQHVMGRRIDGTAKAVCTIGARGKGI